MGILTFKDGLKKAGFFDKNVYVEALTTIDKFQVYMDNQTSLKVPEGFRQEILNYIMSLPKYMEEDSYLGMQLITEEFEDMTGANALLGM